MNLADIVILTVIGIAFILALRQAFRNKGEGGCGNGGCCGCSSTSCALRQKEQDVR